MEKFETWTSASTQIVVLPGISHLNTESLKFPHLKIKFIWISGSQPWLHRVELSQSFLKNSNARIQFQVSEVRVCAEGTAARSTFSARAGRKETAIFSKVLSHFLSASIRSGSVLENPFS